jgi:hypothetical protein
MLAGVDANGAKITYKGRDGLSRDSYSPAYARKMSRPITPIILKRTGSFQRELSAEIGSSVVDFDSRDSKSAMLKDKSGEAIFGLTEGSLEVTREKGSDILIQKVRFKAGL